MKKCSNEIVTMAMSAVVRVHSAEVCHVSCQRDADNQRQLMISRCIILISLIALCLYWNLVFMPLQTLSPGPCSVTVSG